MALLVVVMLGVPKNASAGQPTVSAPTGPQSGGVFISSYTFNTYIYCTSGFNFNSSYTNSLEGTHTFKFYGSADGSLHVQIDSGGMQLITSCGDPLTGPFTNVATYVVTKNSTPPPPTPTPTPTPAPTPTPTPVATPPSGGGGGGSGSSGSGGNHASGSASTPVPTPNAAGPQATPDPGATATPAPQATATPGPTPSAAPAGAWSVTPSPAASVTAKTSAGPAPRLLQLVLAWLMSLGSGLVLILFLLAEARGHHFSRHLRAAFVPLRLWLEPYWFRLRFAVTSRLRRRLRGHDIPRRRGLSAHHHSGKVLAHHHTSYPALAFLLLLSGVLAAAVSYSGRAQSSLLTLTVPGPPPSAAATIDQPVTGQHLTSATQTVRGTCPTGLLIEIYRNGVFAGSTLCDVSGLYNVVVTLVPGQNDLVARDRDGLGQYGPDSTTVTVYYDAPAPTPTPTPSATPSPTSTPTPRPTTGPSVTPRPSATPKPSPVPSLPPLLLDSDQHFYQGVEINAPIDWTVKLSGGKPPYQLIWQWGDGASTQATESNAGPASATHAYDKAGTYQASLRARDATGREAVIQIVVIVDGPLTTTGAGTVNTDGPGNLIFIWPLLVLATLVVLSFWLGERHKLSTWNAQPAT